MKKLNSVIPQKVVQSVKKRLSPGNRNGVSGRGMRVVTMINAHVALLFFYLPARTENRMNRNVIKRMISPKNMIKNPLSLLWLTLMVTDV